MKIALIAHDKKKQEIIELAKKYKDVLAKYDLYAIIKEEVINDAKYGTIRLPFIPSAQQISPLS